MMEAGGGEDVENSTVNPQSSNPVPGKPSRPPRSYAQLTAELKKGKGVAMSKEESKVFSAGRMEVTKAEKEREDSALESFWALTRTLSGNVLFKTLFFLIYGIWTVTPVIGIVIGILYVSHDSCPARPSIAPLLIVLGVMSILVSFSIVTKKTQERGRRGGTKKASSATQSKATDDPETGDLAMPLQPVVNGSEEAQGQNPTAGKVLCQSLGDCGGGCLLCFILLFKITHFVLFVLTSCIVYGFYPYAIYDKAGLSESEIETSYCSEVLLLFGFWSITLSYMILGALVFIFCCSCLSLIAWMSYATQRNPDANS